jgi:multiple sugar transport system permease protein/putative aldouronate transport system permease protein
MASHITRDTGSDRLYSIVNYVILFLFLLAVAYPLVYVLSASFSSPSAVTTGKVWLWPVELSLDGYRAVFREDRIWIGFRNSLFYATAGTLVNVVLTILAAYPLSRKDFAGRGVIMFFFVFTLLFGGGLIPTYLVVKQTGLLNTPWAMIIPGALSVYNMIITRTFFQQTIPDELFEAAQLDGVTNFRFVRDVVIPLSGPIIAVNALFYAVGHWNAFFNALIYLTNPDLFPLQLILRDILLMDNINPESMQDLNEMFRRQQLANVLKYGLIVVATVPVLAIYPFVQKHFVKGVLIGSLKG